MMAWLTEHIETIMILGVVAFFGVLNCFAKQAPKRDLKSPEYKSLDRRFKDAYKRAVFGEDEE